MIYIITYVVFGVFMFVFAAGLVDASGQYDDKKWTASGILLGGIVFGLVWPAILVYAIGSAFGDY